MSSSSSDGEIWCPFCSSPLTGSGALVECTACGRIVDVASAAQASEQWRARHHAEDRLAQINADIASLHHSHVIWSTALQQATSDFGRARANAVETSRLRALELETVRPEPLPTPQQPTLPPLPAIVPTAAAATQPTPAPAARHPRIPLALLLQGVGAILLLAALVTVSAVLWGVLPGAGQVALLCAAVVVVGGLAVATRRALPTTSAVLAALAAAALLVVLVAVPGLTAIDPRSAYPSIAAILFATLMLTLGKFARIRLWWLVGVIALPAVGLIVVLSLLDVWSTGLTPVWQMALATVLFTPLVAGMFALARQQHHKDRVTSATAWWAGLVASAPLALAGAFAAMQTLLPHYETTSDRNALTVILLGTAGLAGVLWWASRTVAARVGTTAAIASAAWTGFAVISLLVSAPDTLAWAIAILAATLGVFAAGRWSAVRATPSGRRWFNVATSSFAVAALSNSLLMGPGAIVTTCLSIGIGAVLAAEGLVTHDSTAARTTKVAGGWTLAAAGWAFAWLAWLEAPGPFEVLTVPVGAAAVALVVLARRRGLAVPIPVGALVLATATPTLIAVLADPEFARTVTLWRLLAVTGSCGLVAVWPVRPLLPLGATAVAMALASPLWSYLVAMGQRDLAPYPEVFLAPIAAVVAAVTIWVAEPRTPGQWLRAVQWPFGAVAAVAVAMALLVPFATSDDPVARIRVLLVIAVAGTAAVATWSHRRVAPWLALTALAVAWWNLMIAVAELTDPLPEAFTLPTALAAGATVALIRRATDRTMWAPPVWTTTAVLALAPSTLLALTNPITAGTTTDTIRVITVIVITTVGAVVLRQHRPISAALASTATVVVWWNVMAALPASDQWVVERWTLPTAAALAVVLGLLRWAAQRPLPSIATIGPPLALALLPSAFASAADVVAEDGSGLRIFLVLLVASACVAIGAVKQLAGVLLPGLAALVIVLIPITLLLTLVTGVWIPLLIGGAGLLFVGARLEYVRRQGRAVAVWLSHLH